MWLATKICRVNKCKSSNHGRVWAMKFLQMIAIPTLMILTRKMQLQLRLHDSVLRFEWSESHYFVHEPQSSEVLFNMIKLKVTQSYTPQPFIAHPSSSFSSFVSFFFFKSHFSPSQATSRDFMWKSTKNDISRAAYPWSSLNSIMSYPRHYKFKVEHVGLMCLLFHQWTGRTDRYLQMDRLTWRNNRLKLKTAWNYHTF